MALKSCLLMNASLKSRESAPMAMTNMANGHEMYFGISKRNIHSNIKLVTQATANVVINAL
jgi:hypothetical protein